MSYLNVLHFGLLLVLLLKMLLCGTHFLCLDSEVAINVLSQQEDNIIPNANNVCRCPATRKQVQDSLTKVSVKVHYTKCQTLQELSFYQAS